MSKLPAGSRTPKAYIKTIAEIEESVNEALAKAKVTPKKMNATQARALNAVKQKVKKTNKDYQAEIAVYREDKDTYLWSSDEEEEAPQPKLPKAVKFDETAGADEAADDGFATVGKGGRTLQYTPESIFKHLRGIMETRGKKNTDRLEQIKVMEKLNEIANTPYQKIRVLLTLVSARFDLGAGATNVMPLDHWKAAEKELSQLLTILSEAKEYVVLENVEEWDDDEKPPTLQAGEKYIKVAGSIVSYVERLDDELHRSLQSIDPHTSEYIERLQDEGALYNVIFRGLLYYETLKKDETLDVPQDSVNRIVMRRLEHVYFKVRSILNRRLLWLAQLTVTRSLPKLSRPSKRTAGRLLVRTSTLPPLPVLRLWSLPTWSTFSAPTSTPTARASFAPELCSAKSTSSLCTMSTTRLAT